MAGHLFAGPGLAVLYDVLNPAEDRGDFGFYLPLVMSARSVLDAGCGTGTLLHSAREAGHGGRLCGVDPAEGMLEQARLRTGIEWVLGDLGTGGWDGEFGLIVMTGHAFQVLVEDGELRTALAAVRTALTDDGRFAFETRSPRVRAWENWTPDRAVEAVGPTGCVVRLACEVETPVGGDLVSFTQTFTGPDWDRPQASRSTLRFLDTDALSSFLEGAGLVVEGQFGDWDGSPLTDSSPEIITVVRRGPSSRRRPRNSVLCSRTR